MLFNDVFASCTLCVSGHSKDSLLDLASHPFTIFIAQHVRYVPAVGYVPDMDTLDSLICHDGQCHSQSLTIGQAYRCVTHVWLCINQHVRISLRWMGSQCVAGWCRLDIGYNALGWTLTMHVATFGSFRRLATTYSLPSSTSTKSLVSSHKFHYYSSTPHTNSCVSCVRRNIRRLFSSKLAFCS